MRRRRFSVSPRAERALVAAGLVETVVELLVRTDTEHSVLAVGWMTAVIATLFVRRTQPVAGAFAAATMIALAPVMAGRSGPSFTGFLLPVVLAFACGAYAATGPGLAAVAALTIGLQIFTGFADAPNLELAIMTLPVWLVGREVRRRRALVDELAERTRELEAAEEAFVRLTVEHERARIARDLHDIVSHHVALMVIQAGAGRLAEPWDDEIAANRFATIRDAGTQALTEADRLVTVLRPEAEEAHLAALLDRARELGARVVVAPHDMSLPPDLELLAHHVTREALTNAMKHGAGAPLELDLELDAVALTITARNRRMGAASPIAETGSGLGLAGMRERVAAAGGSLAAGPEGVDFVLRATLPTRVYEPVAAG
jgi:signal transduction histidine kinase